MVELMVNERPTGTVVRMADRWWSRAIGLLATARLDHPAGLWITPCASVHTVGMRYPIDLVYLDRERRILKTVTALKPWRASACRGAVSVIELRAGLVSALGLRAGQRVSSESCLDT